MVKSIGTIQLDKDLSNDAAGMEYGTVTILSHWELIDIHIDIHMEAFLSTACDTPRNRQYL